LKNNRVKQILSNRQHFTTPPPVYKDNSSIFLPNWTTTFWTTPTFLRKKWTTPKFFEKKWTTRNFFAEKFVCF